MKPYIPWILLGAGIIEMILKLISGFTDPEALQLGIDFVCLFLVVVTAFMYAMQQPESGRRGRS